MIAGILIATARLISTVDGIGVAEAVASYSAGVVYEATFIRSVKLRPSMFSKSNGSLILKLYSTFVEAR